MCAHDTFISITTFRGSHTHTDMDIKDKEQRQRPPNITTPKRGPLLLQNAIPPSQSPEIKMSARTRSHYGNVVWRFVSTSSARREEARERQRKGVLTRFPISVSLRPMEEIEEGLKEGVTWSQLKYIT